MFRRCSVIIALCLLAAAYGEDPNSSATISGRVLDFESHSVAGAKISVFPMDVGTSGPMPSATTDLDGRYSLILPPYPGRTRLCAIKESAGYPNTQSTMFVSGKDSRPIVSLTPGAHFDNVDIHLGPPDGIVEGVVVDKDTGVPLWQARITLHRTDMTNGIYSSTLPQDARFLFALPPVPVEITVVAPQHIPWSYADPQTGANSLVLQSSEHRTLTIKLSGTK